MTLVTRIYSLMGLALLVLIGCTNPTASPTDPVALLLPDSVRAGQEISLKARALNPGTDFVVCQQGERTQVWRADTLPVRWPARKAGVVLFWVFRAGQVMASARMRVFPASVQQVPLYVGAKSLVANGRSVAMLLTFPTDAFGNPASNGTRATFALLRPDGASETAFQTTRYGLAYHVMNSRKQAGKSLATVTVNHHRSDDRVLSEVPGPPADFTIRASQRIAYADGREYFELETDVLHDEVGNVVSDGTLVRFSCREPNGTLRWLTASTVVGRAQTRIQNPATAGVLQLRAQVQQAGHSNTLFLSFAPSQTSPLYAPIR
jgi:hypothetical protein